MSASSVPRYRRDFVTNPSFEETILLLEEMRRRETENLKTASRQGELARINTQVGVVDGIERVMLRLQNMKKDLLTPLPPGPNSHPPKQEETLHAA